MAAFVLRSDDCLAFEGEGACLVDFGLANGEASSIGEEHRSITGAGALFFAFSLCLRELSGTLSVSKSSDLGLEGITLRLSRLAGGAIEATRVYQCTS